MKNFLRSLKYAWAYRVRLLLSLLFALAAAGLWGGGLSAIYPVLTILGSGKSLQTWVDEEIAKFEKDIRDRSAKLDQFEAEFALVKPQPNGDWKRRKEFELSREIAKLNDEVAAATVWHYRYQQLKNYFIRFLPLGRFEALACILGLVVLSVALKGLFEFGQDALVGSVMNRTLFDLRNTFFRRVLHLDVGDFKDEGSHELMARFTNDMGLLGEGIKTIFGKVVSEPLRALACVVAASWISWQLTLLFLVLVPVSLVILARVSRMMKRASRRLLERMAGIYKQLQETFQGIRVVKAFAREPRERRRFHAATKDYYHKAMQVVTIDAAASPIIELLGVMAVALALLAGTYLVLNETTHLFPGTAFAMRMTAYPMRAETLLQLYAFLAAIADPVRKLSSVYTKLQSGAAAADRIFAFLDRTPRVALNAHLPALRRHAHSVEFRDVCYSYRPGEPVLSNVNLTVKAGEAVAVVGRNGCGKTTLCGLLPRFYDPDHGRVLIDGIDLREVSLRSLRRQIGLVSQEVLLFDDTVYANLAYGRPKATEAEVEEAAKKAFAHDFIMQRSGGYQARLGEGGAKLSGGQKQRIALARAILRNPSILILDEFTSQVDAESQQLIQEAIREFVRGRTTFVITHSLATLKMADRIVVLERGRLAAVGTHPELLKTCEVYQRLYEEADFNERKVA
jgi:subfamily B ATP-binding cassette protein MsbA